MAGERGPRIRRLQGPRHLQNTPDRWTDSKSLVQDHRLGTSTTRAITAILRYRGTTCASYHVLLGPGSNIYLRDGGIGTLPAHTRPGLSASRTQNEGRGEERWVHDVFLARPGTGGPLHWRAECKLGLRTDRLSTASQRRFDPTTRTPTRVKKKKKKKKKACPPPVHRPRESRPRTRDTPNGSLLLRLHSPPPSATTPVQPRAHTLFSTGLISRGSCCAGPSPRILVTGLLCLPP